MEVRFAAGLEDACEALAGEVRRAREARGPLAPVTLWVPGSTVGTFAKMDLARRLGVAALIETSNILSGIAALATECSPPLRRLDAPAIRGRLLSLLFDAEFLATPSMAPLAAWIGEGAAAARRRSELAAELARQFDGYLTARPRWSAARLRALAADEVSEPAERWQLELLRRVIDGSDAVPLAALVAACGGSRLPPEIHVLGWSVLSIGVLDALEQLGRRTRVIIYAPNPSRALWADTSIDRRDLSILLARSGRAHREQIMRLLERTGYEAGDLPSTRAAPRTLLEHAQRCLDDTTDTPWTLGADDSLQVVACPGIRREVEMVAQTIWALIQQSDREGQHLRFDRIALYYVDREDQPYAAHIDALLEQANGIPRRLAERPLCGETPVVGAVRALLRVPLGERTRPEVLSVLSHPLIRGRWNDADADEWLKWCAAVGIVRGDDARALDGSYLEGEPLLHWDQGLRRLALGTLAGRAPTEVDGHIVLPEPIEGTRARAAGRLVLLARSLLADAHWLAAAELPIARWLEVMGALIAAYVTPTDEASTAAVRACLAAVAKLTSVDAGDTPLPYRVIHDLVAEKIDGLLAPSGSPLAGGVHVAPLRLGEVVPFDVIFVLGLDAAHFPARAAVGDLDLRPRNPAGASKEDLAEHALDAPTDDRDRTAFLELILAARRKLILSWECRDAVTGEDKAHSPVVGHVLRWVEAVGCGSPLRTLPVGRQTADDTDAVDPSDAVDDGAGSPIDAERRAELLGRVYAAAGGDRADDVRDAVGAAAEATREDLARTLGIVPLPSGRGGPLTGQVAEIELRLSKLRRFLECPLQGSAAYALRLSTDEDEDAMALEAEPLAYDAKGQRKILRSAFERGVPDGVSRALEVLAQDAFEHRARAEGPAGLFGDAAHRASMRVISAWGAQLAGRTIQPLSLGTPRAGAGPSWVEPPLLLDTRAGPVRLVGETSLVSRQPRATVTLQYARRSAARPYDWRTGLRAVLDHAVLTVLEGRSAPHEVFMIAADAQGEAHTSSRTLAAISVEDARRFLSVNAAAMLDGPVTVLFPIEAVAAFAEGGHIEQVVESVREDLLSEHPHSPSHYGPIRDPEIYAAPDMSTATAIRDRLALALSLVRVEKGHRK